MRPFSQILHSTKPITSFARPEPSDPPPAPCSSRRASQFFRSPATARAVESSFGHPPSSILHWPAFPSPDFLAVATISRSSAPRRPPPMSASKSLSPALSPRSASLPASPSAPWTSPAPTVPSPASSAAQPPISSRTCPRSRASPSPSPGESRSSKASPRSNSSPRTNSPRPAPPSEPPLRCLREPHGRRCRDHRSSELGQML